MTVPAGSTTEAPEADQSTTDPSWDEGLYDEADSALGADGSNDSSPNDAEEESPELRERKEELREREEAIARGRAELEEERARVVDLENYAKYKGKPDEEKKAEFLRDTYGATKEDEKRELFEGFEEQELIQEFVDSPTDAIIAAHDEIDGVTWTKLLDALDGDPDRRREVVTRVATEHPVKGTVPDPTEDGSKPEPRNYGAEFREGPLREMIPEGGLEGHVEDALRPFDRGEIKLDSAASQELEALRADPALSYPDGHSHKVRALEALAGFASWAEAEWSANLPFPIGGIQSSTTYQRADGSDWLRVQDGRGTIRETPIEGGMAASELGLVKEPGTVDPDTTDYANLTVQEAMQLGPVGWARYREANPEGAEAALRASSEALEERALEMRQGGL